MSGSTRREFLASTGALAAAWLGADRKALAAGLAAQRKAAQGGQVPFELLSAEQAADLDAIAERILPADGDLPGAREARVVVFIDRALSGYMADDAETILGGIAALNRGLVMRGESVRFAGLTDQRQIVLLREIEDSDFFQRVRVAVLVGMFAHPSQGGNVDEAGWRLLGFEPRYVWRPPFGEYDAEEMGR